MEVGALEGAKRKSIEVFCCYAREDQRLLLKLKTHLTQLQREELITLWADVNINAGEEWEKQIKEHLNTAKIFLLLVSPDFMASDYCMSVEMQRAMERHDLGEARVVPIILRPVSWQGAPFSKLHALPANANPITSGNWHNQDEAFYAVAEGIRDAVKTLAIKNPADKVHSPDQAEEEKRHRDEEAERTRKMEEERQRRVEVEQARQAEEAEKARQIEEERQEAEKAKEKERTSQARAERLLRFMLSFMPILKPSIRLRSPFGIVILTLLILVLLSGGSMAIYDVVTGHLPWSALPGQTWHVQYSGTSQDLKGVIWSGSQYVAVGNYGAIVTSPDGSTWIASDSRIGYTLFGVTWSHSQYVAVGYNGTIITSPDGHTWTVQNSGTSRDLFGVTWSGSQFVALGDSGTVLASPDGSTWTIQNSGTPQKLSCITWSGSQFVVLGDSGTVLTSP